MLKNDWERFVKMEDYETIIENDLSVQIQDAEETD